MAKVIFTLRVIPSVAKNKLLKISTLEIRTLPTSSKGSNFSRDEKFTAEEVEPTANMILYEAGIVQSTHTQCVM